MRSSTSRHLVSTAAVLLLAAAGAAACQSDATGHDRAMMRSTGQASSPMTGPAAGQRTYFAQYGVNTPGYKPRQLNPSVDGSLFIGGMRWSVWDARRAVGHGVAHVDDCKPDCASGHYATHPVTVRLGHPRELCGRRFFTTIAVKGPGYHTFAHRHGVGCQ